MTEDHERSEELLAGYALLSLSGKDAAEVDRLLAEHVPGCARCRRTLEDFQALSGDLALAAPMADPPETMLPRIHRAMDEVPLEGRRPRRGALVAVAASAIALVAMGGLSLVLGNRLNDAQTQAGTALEILSAMRSPGATPVDVAPQGQTPPESWMVEVSAPQDRRIFVAATNCPEPGQGHGYQLWLHGDAGWVPVGEMFWPRDGAVLLEVTDVDVARYDAIWVSEEVAGAAPSEPSTEWHGWFGELS
ncbi:MAG: anti-sigma factor [Actinobacteria bacterium]|nr:anti-sigma factor [Actinomycetota bacterium]